MTNFIYEMKKTAENLSSWFSAVMLEITHKKQIN